MPVGAFVLEADRRPHQARACREARLLGAHWLVAEIGLTHPGFGALAVRGLNAFARVATIRAVERPRSPAAREGLLFPYLDGGEFMRWWNTSRFKDTLPYGPRMPTSTEQILHPERYGAGDVPIRIAFTDTVPGAYEDVLGEFDIRMLMQELTGKQVTRSVLPLGWGGDRFRLDESDGKAGLVWISVWDQPRHRDWFLAQAGDALRARAAKGYRVALDTMTVGTHAGLRYAVGDPDWRGWTQLPSATIVGQ